jgi:hypothetical protein
MELNNTTALHIQEKYKITKKNVGKLDMKRISHMLRRYY